MSETSEPVPPISTASIGTERGTVRYSVPEVARVLGISERAVRKQITAGTLDAHKEGSAWVELLPATPGAVPAAPAAPRAVPDGASRGGTAAVDVAPLAELIGRLTRVNQELRRPCRLGGHPALTRGAGLLRQDARRSADVVSGLADGAGAGDWAVSRLIVPAAVSSGVATEPDPEHALVAIRHRLGAGFPAFRRAGEPHGRPSLR